MFSPNQIDILSTVAQLHQEDLLHEAEEQRRFKLSRGEQPAFSILKRAAFWFGAALIALGERLAAGQAPVVQSTRLTEKCA